MMTYTYTLARCFSLEGHSNVELWVDVSCMDGWIRLIVGFQPLMVCMGCHTVTVHWCSSWSFCHPIYDHELTTIWASTANLYADTLCCGFTYRIYRVTIHTAVGDTSETNWAHSLYNIIQAIIPEYSERYWYFPEVQQISSRKTHRLPCTQILLISILTDEN